MQPISNGTSHKRLWLSAAIILLVVVGSFALSVPRTRDMAVRQAPEENPPAPAITIRDSYRGGVHTITGTVEAPNACTAVTATATLEGEAENTARILLEISMPQDEGICLQIPTPIAFEARVEAPADVPITAMINGALASSTPSGD